MFNNPQNAEAERYISGRFRLIGGALADRMRCIRPRVHRHKTPPPRGVFAL